MPWMARSPVALPDQDSLCEAILGSEWGSYQYPSFYAECDAVVQIRHTMPCAPELSNNEWKTQEADPRSAGKLQYYRSEYVPQDRPLHGYSGLGSRAQPLNCPPAHAPDRSRAFPHRGTAFGANGRRTLRGMSCACFGHRTPGKSGFGREFFAHLCVAVTDTTKRKDSSCEAK